ncbi:MAG: PrsW family glutamic-type intramembrane protease [Kofleriaceae bacterium]
MWVIDRLDVSRPGHQRLDGIDDASRARVGFALVENAMYLLGQQTLSGQLYVWVARALLAIPGHARWRLAPSGSGLGLFGGPDRGRAPGRDHRPLSWPSSRAARPRSR